MYINSIDIVWLLSVKVGAVQATYLYGQIGHEILEILNRSAAYCVHFRSILCLNGSTSYCAHSAVYCAEIPHDRCISATHRAEIPHDRGISAAHRAEIPHDWCISAAHRANSAAYRVISAAYRAEFRKVKFGNLYLYGSNMSF